jgi:hypothetical protein
VSLFLNIPAMSNLVEIKKAIERLTADEKEELRDWLEADVAEVEHRWVLEALERLHGINAGERKPIDAVEVLAEARRIAGQ